MPHCVGVAGVGGGFRKDVENGIEDLLQSRLLHRKEDGPKELMPSRLTAHLDRLAGITSQAYEE